MRSHDSSYMPVDGLQIVLEHLPQQSAQGATPLHGLSIQSKIASDDSILQGRVRIDNVP